MPALRIWEYVLSWKKDRPPTESGAVLESEVKGFYRGREQVISGWILDLQDSRNKREVEVFIQGKSIGTARGDRFDSLVQSHHGGDGLYGFAIYYDGDLAEPTEVTVVDKQSGWELRSKQPLITRASRSGAPLAIDKLSIGQTVEIQGSIGAYPWSTDLTLEIWQNSRRVVSAIPVSVSKSDGLFSAQIGSETLHYMLTDDVEIALPGLKEAGLAVPFNAVHLLAIVSEHGDEITIGLRGNFEQAGPISASLRFITEQGPIDQEILFATSEATRIRPPLGFALTEEGLQLWVRGTPVPIRIEWSLLEDTQFREIGSDNSPWVVSENATIEGGFFAFPASLADEHEISGYFAHLSRTSSEGPLKLQQSIMKVPDGSCNASITIFARGMRKAEIAARVRDDAGLLTEATVSCRSSEAWSVLRLALRDHRQVQGNLIFEVETTGRHATDLDVALGNSRTARPVDQDTLGANLLVNDGFQSWPHGVGIREHVLRGDICAGWKVFNRGSQAPILSRAAMHPQDGSLGFAAAAAEVSHYIRLEADLTKTDLAGQHLVLRYRAGCIATAKHLLASQAEAIPGFSVIDRAFVIRRIRSVTQEGFEERDEVAAVFARKVSVSSEIEDFEYQALVTDGATRAFDETGPVEESYHLAFDFRHPTGIAFFNVELLTKGDGEVGAEVPRLMLEDRNIQLQIEKLEALAHWRGPTPVRLTSAALAAPIAPLKWKFGPSQEIVTIVIPVFNALAETLACLDSLNGSTTVPIAVRVIDDGSEQAVKQALEHYALDKPWVRVESLGKNKGYTFAADYGVRGAPTDWVVLLNSDTIVTRGWLEGMLACARSDPNTAFVGPLSNAASYQSVPELYDASRKWKINRLPPGFTPENMAEIVKKVSKRDYPEVPLLNGFCTLMKRSVFLELGGLNPIAFPAGYGEENDLCLRAGKSGVKLAVADDVYVYHVKSASFGSARREELTKSGNEAFRKLHPDTDINALTTRFRETPALVAVRQATARELSKAHQPPQYDAQKPEPPAVPGEGRNPQLQKA